MTTRCAVCGIAQGPFVAGPLPRQRICAPARNLFHEVPGKDTSKAHSLCNIRRDAAAMDETEAARLLAWADGASRAWFRSASHA